MKRWAIYYPDGRIGRVYSGTEDEALIQPQGEEQVAEISDGLDDSTAYIIGGQVVLKQPFTFQMSNPQIVADGMDEFVVGNIPAGTVIQWPDGQIDEVADGEVRFAVDLPGTYTLKFSAVPYLDEEVTVEAVAAA